MSEVRRLIFTIGTGIDADGQLVPGSDADISAREILSRLCEYAKFPLHSAMDMEALVESFPGFWEACQLPNAYRSGSVSAAALHSPPQIYGGVLRHVFVMLMSFGNYLTAGF